MRVAKGARHAIAALAGAAIDAEVTDRLTADGQRVLTVAEDRGSGYRPLGFIAFADPLRADAPELIAGLRSAGIRVLMLTGDTLGTARSVGRRLGFGEQVVTAEDVRRDASLIDRAGVVARVLPDDKFAIVRRLQARGHVCGMTGDGVNDAPALQAAQVGVAVAGATDAAKAAASLVLTTPGLTEILPAVEESRRIFHRLSIYTTNKVTKTIEIGLVLTIAALSTGVVPLTPLLMILLIFGNDFATMAISADRVSFSPLPERWSARPVLFEGGTLAVLLSFLSLAVFFAARDVLRLSIPQIQTMMFLLLVCSSQGLIYLVRERRAFWLTRPATALVGASLIDVAISTALAVSGTLMVAVPSWLAGELIAVVLVYLGIIGLVRSCRSRGHVFARDRRAGRAERGADSSST